MELHHLLDEYDITLVLLDLGASGGTYPPFNKALKFSKLIEVDPDKRDFDNLKDSATRTIITKAVTDNDSDDSLTIYLTKNPHCSSSLEPNFDRLNNFTYADLLKVESKKELPATSLNRLAAELDLSFDWIKMDTQGTEHRIPRNMKKELLDRLICCDIEISLYAHYNGADTLPGLHDFMVANGFTISDIMHIQGRVRLRKQDIKKLKSHGLTEFGMKKWPTSPEIRYIRSLNHNEPITDIELLTRIWAISFITKNYPYCYFLSQKLRESSQQHNQLAVNLEKLSLRELSRNFPRLARWFGSNISALTRRMFD